MKRLVKTIFYYDDNTFEEVINGNDLNDPNNLTKEDILEEIFSDIKSGKRIQINVALYRLLKEYYKGDDTKINDAMNDIARYQNITRSSVVDKVLRQLNLTSVEYRGIVTKALNNDSEELKGKLLNNLGAYTQDGDKELIEKYIK